MKSTDDTSLTNNFVEHDAARTLGKAVNDMVATIAICESQIEALQEQVRSLRQQVGNIRIVRAALLSEGGDATVHNLKELVADESFAARKRERKTSASWKVRKAAFAVLKAHGRPMTRVEIYRQLKAAGIVVSSTDPERAVGKVLWAAEEFVHVQDGYWLAEEPLPHERKPT